MEVGVQVLMGICLAACAGLRAFLPLFAIGVAERAGVLELQSYMTWLGSTEALITFGVATVAELLADKVPVLDHALDLFQSVARPVAGAAVAFGALQGLSPTYAAVVGIVVGAPVAGTFHLAKATTRATSSALTFGVANPVVSVLEDFVAFAGAVLAILVPVAAAILLVLTGWIVVRWWQSRRRRRAKLV